MIPPTPTSPPGRWRLGLAVFLGVLILAAPQAALLPLLDRDEPRFAEASREMLQSGNFVVPTFNHAPRYAKPPLIYWAQAACFRLLGGNDFAARLPSLLATAGTAALLFAWGAEFQGPAAGLIAALGYALCLQTMQQGRAATADALLIFFVALTGYAGWKMLGLLRVQPTKVWAAWGLMLTLGLAGGFLAKGPEALLPMASVLWMARRSGARVISAFLAIPALSLFVVSWWAIPAYIQTGGAYWREGLGHDVGDRMVSGFQGHGAGSFGWYLLSLPLYFVIFWLSALPWSPLLFMGGKRLFHPRQLDPADSYLLLNAALYFGVFSLMVTKLPHYTLPAFPFLALLFAKRWVAAGLSPRAPVAVTLFSGLLLAIVALFLIPLWIIPRANPSPTETLVREAGGTLTRETDFALVDFLEPNPIWEMRRVVRGFARTVPPEQVLGFLRGPGPRAVLLTTPAWRKLSAGSNGREFPETLSAPGWNAAKGKFFELTLVVKPG